MTQFVLGCVTCTIGGSPEADWYEVLNINIDEIHCCNSMAARDSSQKPFPTTAMLNIHIHCVLISNHEFHQCQR